MIRIFLRKSILNKGSFERVLNHKKENTKSEAGYVEIFVFHVTKATGGAHAFIFAFTKVVGWALWGPTSHYSENWLMVITF